MTSGKLSVEYRLGHLKSKSHSELILRPPPLARLQRFEQAQPLDLHFFAVA
jgi:hypothetical protein